MSKYEHSDRLSLLRLTQELEADQGVSEGFDPERQIDERFAKAALKVLQAEDPDSTYTLHTAVREVLNHWIINFDLPVYRDGCRITDPIAVFSETHTPWEETGLISPGGKSIVKPHDILPDMDYFEDRIFIHKEDFEALCRRKNLPLPTFWFSGKQPRKPPQAAQRDDALSHLARRTYKALCDQGEKPTYRQVIDALEFYEDKQEFKNTVEDIDRENEVILWINDRGKEQATSFANFKKRLTRIRKTMPSG